MSLPNRLILTLAGLMLVQSVSGLAASAAYRDAEWIKATWFGNDWVTLVVAVPLVVFSSARSSRGSVRAWLLTLGGVGYAVYNYAFYLFGAALNAFFPLYVVLVVLATTVLIIVLGTADVRVLAGCVRAAVVPRLVAASLIFIGVGLAVAWIATWAAHVFAARPTPVPPEAFRLVAALDLSLMVPALVAGGVFLWRRQPWGLVVGAIAGVQGSLYLAVLTVNSFVAIHRGLTTWPAELPVWVLLCAFTGAVTALLLSQAGRTH